MSARARRLCPLPNTSLKYILHDLDLAKITRSGMGRSGQCPLRNLVARALPIGQWALNGHLSNTTLSFFCSLKYMFDPPLLPGLVIYGFL